MALRRALAGMLAALVALFGVVAFAHTPPGRPLLGWMGRAMGRGSRACPLGYDRTASPEQREEARARFATSHRGVHASAGRPALGFALDRTTRDYVLAWSSSHGISCTPGTGMADLICARVPDVLLPLSFRAVGSRTLSFVFGAGGRLISLTAMSHADRAQPVSAAFGTIVEDLDREAGAPARLDGDPSPESLSSGALYQATAEYRFDDYYAVARATNVGPGNYALTEEYRSLPPHAEN